MVNEERTERDKSQKLKAESRNLKVFVGTISSSTMSPLADIAEAAIAKYAARLKDS
jgi:hypothetical protein